MARILISHFSPVVDGGRHTSVCFFDALAKGFTSCGHEVMQLISTKFLNTAWNGSNDLHELIDGSRLEADIKAFKPDLCVFANNSVPDIAYKVTDCPVLLLLSDTVNFFNDKDKIRARAYGDRLHFYAPFERDLREIEQLFGKASGKVINLLPATGVEAESVPFEHQISFIGSNFQNGKGLGELFLHFPDRARLKQIVDTLRHDTSSLDFLSKDEKQLIEQHVPLTHFPFIFSARDRLLILALLAEEGLSLFGSSNWHETAAHFPDVAASHDPRKVYSLKHNQDIYNASKVCLSVAHSQAEDGFPWRIMDIMASNGCLLSDFKPGLAQFTKGYVDIPMYDSPVDAQRLARKLLQDEPWRKALVEGAQRCIADKGRWIHRFQDMQDQLGISLVKSSAEKGVLTQLYGEDYVIKPAAFGAVLKPGRGIEKLVDRLARSLRKSS